MTQLTPLEKFTVPWGQQDIELQQIDFDGGGMSMLRTRIREKTRFTIFDIDPITAQHWGEALLRWANAQPEMQQIGGSAAQVSADSENGAST
jgi:hypothetical protein